MYSIRGRRKCFGLAVLFTVSFPNFSKSDDLSERNHISQILQLADGEPIPQEVLISSDTNLIGESIVWRLHLRNELQTKEEMADYNYFSDTTIQLLFKERDLEKILSSREFLNTHQTGNSNGRLVPVERATQEFRLAGVAPKLSPRHRGGFRGGPEVLKKVYEILPKYALLDIPGKFSPYGDVLYHTKKYGKLVAALKDEVKFRATWTPTDSLRLSPLLRKTFHIKSSTDLMSDIPYAGNFEAQVWGRLEFSDVSYFMVPRDLSPNLSHKLLATSIPVFFYDEKTFISNSGFKYQRLIKAAPALSSTPQSDCVDFARKVAR